MSIEYLLARLTAQTNWPRFHASGGIPELTAADISVIAAAAPHMSFYALMAKYCDDEASEKTILRWTHLTSQSEWFTNPDYSKIRFEARQLNRLAELAVLAWLHPRLAHATSIESRAAFIDVLPPTFRVKFQNHYAFLIGELGYLESIGKAAVKKFRFEGKAVNA